MPLTTRVASQVSSTGYPFGASRLGVGGLPAPYGETMSFDVDHRTHVILRNAIRCRRCNTVIESVHGHDFKRCECGAVAVDGGKRDLRRCGTDFEELAVLQEREQAS